MPSRVYGDVLDTTAHPSSDSAYLSSSLSSLSRSRSSNNLIVRTYKQATQLYLTRRFRESWDVLETIVNPDFDGDGHEADGQEHGIAPVAQSSRGTRTKVWVFYLSLIHAVTEMGPEDGGKEFGSADAWRAIAKKAREGTAWEEIVNRGYAGQEGEVDAEVVVNLATLLLGHMPDQKMNQARLEGFLASSEDVGGALGYDGVSTPMSTHSSSPKALQARVKVLELYALHVLPEVGEWEYAREFVEGCGNLDEERKEAFLLALEGLKEEREGLKKREVELQEQREREVHEALRRKEQEEKKRNEEAERERQKHEQQQRDQAAKTAANTASNNNNNNEPRTSALSNSGSNTNSNTPNGHARGQPSRPARKTSSNSQQPANAATLLTRLTSMAHHLRHNVGPSLLNARLLMFLFAFLILASRRDIRVKLRRTLADGWDKVRRTVGMGVKVSYV
jgi:hypothetical protein